MHVMKFYPWFIQFLIIIEPCMYGFIVITYPHETYYTYTIDVPQLHLLYC